jgi:hypothetical protein
LLGERITKRIKVYSGEDAAKQVDEFGVGLNVLPFDLGGEIGIDQNQWLAVREQDGK